MAGLGVYARKTWKNFRDDSDRAKAEKKRKENDTHINKRIIR